MNVKVKRGSPIQGNFCRYTTYVNNEYLDESTNFYPNILKFIKDHMFILLQYEPAVTTGDTVEDYDYQFEIDMSKPMYKDGILAKFFEYYPEEFV